MLANCRQTKSCIGLKQPFRKPLSKKVPLYQMGTTTKNGFDDFLKKYPIAILNEYGEKVISGRRIC